MTVTGKEKERYTAVDPLGVDNSYARGKANMDGKDLDKLSWIGKNWNAAEGKEEKDFWHDAAETLRGKYGYSGGQDGSQFLPTQPKQSATAVGMGADTGKRPVYQGGYQNEIDRLLDEVMGRRPFEYDPAADPLYQLYTEQFTRNGQRAMQDTIGQVSARTGGLASSYAGAAGQQVYDQYMTELSGMIPELRQLAYEMYLQDLDQQRDDLSVLVGLDEAQYGRFRDAMGDWENDRDFAYGKSRDEVADSQWQQTFDRGVFESDRDDDWREKEWAYETAQDAAKKISDSDTAYERALELLEAGVMPDSNVLSAAGLTEEQAEAILGGLEPVGGSPDAPKPLDKDGNIDWSKVESESLTGGLTGTEYLEQKREEEAQRNLWASLNNLGIGPISATFAEELMDYGGIVETADGIVKWANGWNASNYEEKLKAAKASNPVVGALRGFGNFGI